MGVLHLFLPGNQAGTAETYERVTMSPTVHAPRPSEASEAIILFKRTMSFVSLLESGLNVGCSRAARPSALTSELLDQTIYLCVWLTYVHGSSGRQRVSIGIGRRGCETGRTGRRLIPNRTCALQERSLLVPKPAQPLRGERSYCAQSTSSRQSQARVSCPWTNTIPPQQWPIRLPPWMWIHLSL